MSIQSFSFKESHNVRIQVIDGEPWFCLKDVCEVLTIANSRRVAAEVLDESGVRKMDVIDIMGREQEATFVNEPNLYRVIFRSNKPEAKQFQDWVFNDVLPSIRKTGKYEHPQYKPQAAELFSSHDIDSLTHLVWSMANGFHFDRAWTQAIWHALRRATGVPSPQHFEIRQLPLLAEECRRIYSITNTLKGAIFDAEKQTIRRVLRHREDEAIVLSEMQHMLEESTQQHYGVMTHALEKWQQANVSQFLQRH